MKIQEIQINNGELFEVMNSVVYTLTDTGSHIETMSPTLAGTITITRCPTSNIPGTTTILGATATNTGNIGNNSFVILITATRSDNSVIIAQGTSANLNLAVGATSAEFTMSYTTPGVNVNVAYEVRADPTFNYCVPNWQCESPLNGYEYDGCGNRRTNSSCNPCVPNWVVGTWGPCQSGNYQTRTVTDTNNCGTTSGRPTDTQYCCYPVWVTGSWGACQPGNVQYRIDTDGCGDSVLISQYCCYPVWVTGSWGTCQPGNIQYRIDTDGCGNSVLTSRYCCYPVWGGGTWGPCQQGNVQYKTETDGCGNSRVVSQYCCYPVWVTGSWGACQSGNVQYRIDTDGCGNSVLTSRYCLYPYAAENGSTPNGTAVCDLDVLVNGQGTIVGWDGSKYLVNLPIYPTTLHVSPSRLKLGSC